MAEGLIVDSLDAFVGAGVLGTDSDPTSKFGSPSTGTSWIDKV